MTAGRASVLERLEALGLVTTNAERLADAMKPVWTALTYMDLDQLRVLKQTDIGRALLIVGTAFAVWDNGDMSGNNTTFWVAKDGGLQEIGLEDGSLTNLLQGA
jgi:hypothetical protein